MAEPKVKQLSFWPLLGFINSIPRNLVPFQAFCSRSLNWLVGNQRLLRRKGSLTQVSGVLESSWGALGRRIMSAALPSNTDNYPTWLALFVNETSKMAQIAFRSTNGTPATRVLGSHFGTYHYGWPTTRTDGVPTFRVMPHVYDNERGGMTLGRLASEKQRRFLCGGSRDLLRHGSEVVWGGYTSAPGRSDCGFNDSTSTGDNVLNAAPLGMIPPLQLPVITAGLDLGIAEIGTWRGSDAFFYTVYFENEAGELSTGAVPQPPNSVAVGYVGFGYKQVSTASPTHYFKSLLLTNIAIGPPGTKVRHVARSTKVSIDATALSPFPSTKQLYFWIRIDNNTQTSYEALDGSDESLDSSPVPQLLPALTWAPRGRHMGRFDGRAIIGCLRPNPYALLLAPWASGAVNAAIDDPLLYSGVDYAVAVTPTQLLLRRSTGVTDTFTLATYKLFELVNAINVKQTYSTVTHVGGTATFGGVPTFCVIGVIGIVDVAIGDIVAAPGVAIGSKVTAKVENAGNTYYWLNAPLDGVGIGGTATFYRGTLDATDPAPWGAGVVPGSDGNASADSLLRTLVATTGTSITAGLATMTVPAADAKYMVAGMLVYSARYTAGTEVVSANAATGAVVVSANALTTPGAPEAITFAYDTGDSVLSVSSGVLAASGAPSDFTNSGDLVVTTQNNAAGTTDGNDATIFKVTYTASGAPPLSAVAIEEFVIAAVAYTNITNVRVTIRAKKVDSVNHPNVSIAPIWTHVTPQTLADNVWTDLVFNMPINPVTLAQWTAADSQLTLAGPAITVRGTTAADATVVSVSEYKMEVFYSPGTTAPGYVRTYGNAWPVALPFNKTYLDTFQPSKSALMFTGASSGLAQDAINTWFIGNRRSGPDNFGDVMGFADLGAILYVFFARGRMRLWNPRTGLTHADEDYTLTTSSWTRGARSPYAICSGNGWAIALSDEGFFAMGAQMTLSTYTGAVSASDTAEVLISKNVYDAERADGERGELEYAIKACVAASESGTDGYKVSAEVIGGILYVHYWSSAAAGYPDRELRYDFSMGSGRTGLAEVLQDDGSPYPWSCPLDIRPSCTAKVVMADGATHRMGIVDDNAAATDGRVDEFDYGTEDNGVPVKPEGDTGLQYGAGMNMIQATVLRAILRKLPPAGVSIGVALNPEADPTDPSARFGEFSLDVDVMDDFGRAVVTTEHSEATRAMAALALRISDDGTGPPPEMTQLKVDTIDVPSVGTQR